MSVPRPACAWLCLTAAPVIRSLGCDPGVEGPELRHGTVSLQLAESSGSWAVPHSPTGSGLPLPQCGSCTAQRLHSRGLASVHGPARDSEAAGALGTGVPPPVSQVPTRVSGHAVESS